MRVGEDVPVTRLKLGFDALFTSLLGLLEASLLVNVDLFAELLLRVADVVFFVDADFGEALRLVVLVDGGSEGLAMLFVTFPSDVRRRERDCAFYLDLG